MKQVAQVMTIPRIDTDHLRGQAGKGVTLIYTNHKIDDKFDFTRLQLDAGFNNLSREVRPSTSAQFAAKYIDRCELYTERIFMKTANPFLILNSYWTIGDGYIEAFEVNGKLVLKIESDGRGLTEALDKFYNGVLTDDDYLDYIHDLDMVNQFASENRLVMGKALLRSMTQEDIEVLDKPMNYFQNLTEYEMDDSGNLVEKEKYGVLRVNAQSALLGEVLILTQGHKTILAEVIKEADLKHKSSKIDISVEELNEVTQTEAGKEFINIIMNDRPFWTSRKEN